MDDAGYSSAYSPLHVVICPWLAFGHQLPCLDLAERLASRGHRVSFVSTPRIIARLPPVRPTAAQLINFVALPLPSVDGLPEGAESTNDVPFDKFELHRKAFDGLALPFSEFLGAACAKGQGHKPDWILVDIFHHWAAAAAVEHKVPCAMLLLGAASFIASGAGQLFEHAASGVQVQERPSSTEPPKFEIEMRELIITQRASGMSIAERVSLTLQRSNLAAMRSCVEWEPESVPLVASLGVGGKPVVPLGLLPPSPEGGRGVCKDGKKDATVKWLDVQPAKSVVYVAMGTEVPLPAEQVHELAFGIELAGTRFLWALRKPSGGAPDADILPPGFEDRTAGRGLVRTGWVPQMSILGHDAVGAFLTHCGWNSIIEGLLFGHPLVMLPILGDQGPNARLMEGKKVGVQVQRDGNDGSFNREGVAMAVRAVMVEEESKKIFKANAKKMQEIVADTERHERYIDGFIQQLRSYKE
ncbi:UDP-glycosyltransferase 91C1 [Brachypodium distachyon]|uniref:Glycosyltransferase n=1 Tax=Brachypodium distachyon TaxID=15368 RepID=I1GP10_BRADI|nr:UDP-glycosyltransferase 91C1 [Brachypodium distachyon]KQK13538.1 hypothetical protein BRADI_1g10820v3 [Brachypodium distachyon]|eukprot:XP_003560664.1 UDP-glycosyltransferase 91C1 [Brachypodium distachyon]